ncbi:ATP-dependent DNA ligase [Streptomyces olivaceus]
MVADKTDAVRAAFLDGRSIATSPRDHGVSRGAIRTAVADLLPDRIAAATATATATATAKEAPSPELPVTLAMPGTVTDRLRTTELESAERAALDQDATAPRGQGYILRRLSQDLAFLLELADLLPQSRVERDGRQAAHRRCLPGPLLSVSPPRCQQIPDWLTRLSAMAVLEKRCLPPGAPFANWWAAHGARHGSGDGDGPSQAQWTVGPSVAKYPVGVADAFGSERPEPRVGCEVHHAQRLVDITVPVFDAIELGVEEHQHVVVLETYVRAALPVVVGALPGQVGDEVLHGHRAVGRDRPGAADHQLQGHLPASGAVRLPDATAMDSELVVWDAAGPLDSERLQNRLARRGAGADRAAEEWAAHFVAFDLLRLSGTVTTGWPYSRRRAALESGFGAHRLFAPWALCPSTTDPDTVREWLSWATVGMEGVVFKRLTDANKNSHRNDFRRRQQMSAHPRVRKASWISSHISQGIRRRRRLRDVPSAERESVIPPIPPTRPAPCPPAA